MEANTLGASRSPRYNRARAPYEHPYEHLTSTARGGAYSENTSSMKSRNTRTFLGKNRVAGYTTYAAASNST